MSFWRWKPQPPPPGSGRGFSFWASLGGDRIIQCHAITPGSSSNSSAAERASLSDAQIGQVLGDRGEHAIELARILHIVSTWSDCWRRLFSRGALPSMTRTA